MMNRFFYPAKALLLGLFTAQVLASVHIYLSNISLYRFLLAIKNSGYFPIPNEQSMKGLTELHTAFFGGLFFTMTIGSTLSLFAITAAWIWHRLFFRNIYLLAPFLLLWAAVFVAVNFHGFCLLKSSWFLIIPAVAFTSTLKWIPGRMNYPAAEQRGILESIERPGLRSLVCLWQIKPSSTSGGLKQNTKPNTLLHASSIILLLILWIPQFSNDIFIEFRDRFLLSNSIGEKINSFYYRYTLYPAEAFKSLDQRLLKSCNLNSVEKKPLKLLLEKELLKHDYLSLPQNERVDLQIIENGGFLIFKNGDSTVLSLTEREFRSRTRVVLEEFSLKTDRNILFRKLTFFSIFLGLPITLYLMLYTLFRFTLSSVMSPGKAGGLPRRIYFQKFVNYPLTIFITFQFITCLTLE
ncbi:MAG: hypothetical protein JXA35_03780 [Deltaproteobacteria bacterium]|nr:hypothetical protein [Deltaproteobacteria bacterium]